MAEMEDTVEYLAIGSMMNKVSLSIRGVYPKESRPACLPDYELVFAMADGFAAARRAPGKKLHGVLHRISSKELAELDIIEFWYVKEKVQVLPYQGAWDASETLSVEANVYVFDPEALSADPDKFSENPPSERYLDILKEGAKQFGLDPAFVERYLTNSKCVPRKQVTELRCFSIPSCDLPLPTWSFEQVKAKDKEDEDIIFLALNKKVLRFDLRLPVKYTKVVRLNRGKQWAFQIVSKFRYDPRFGVPATYEDMTEEHRLYVEDTVLDSYLVGELNKRWSIVALLRE